MIYCAKSTRCDTRHGYRVHDSRCRFAFSTLQTPDCMGESGSVKVGVPERNDDET